MSGESPGINPLVAIRTLNASPSNRDTAGAASQLATATPGTEIKGFVINRTANLQPILRTAFGDIVVESEFFLKTGSEVTIRVDPNVAGRARIVKIDGLLPQQYAAQHAGQSLARPTNAAPLPSTNTPEAALAPKAPVAQGSASTSPAQTSQRGAIIQALYIPPSAENKLPALPPNILSPTVRLPDGTQFSPETSVVSQLQANLQKHPSLELQLLARALPTLGAFSPLPEGKAPIQTTASPLPPPQAAIPGQTLAALADSIRQQPSSASSASLPPQASAPNTAAPLAPPPPTIAAPPTTPAPVTLHNASHDAPITQTALNSAVTGTVVRVEGQTSTIQTALGHIQLLNARPLPVGSTVLFAVNSDATVAQRTNTASTSLPLLPANLAPVGPLLQEWETLEQVLLLLQRAYPEAAQTLNDRIPQPGPKLSAAMLFVLNALKGGNIRELFGRSAAEPLESQHASLLSKLSNEWSGMQKVSREPVSNEWNMMLIPVWHEDKAQQIRLFVRNDGHAETSAIEGAGQRFLLELGLSALGDIQLDGFVHGEKPNARFDMVLRTQRPWPDALHKDIEAIFSASIQAVGMQGGISKQVGEQHFIRPLHYEADDPSGTDPYSDGLIA